MSNQSTTARIDLHCHSWASDRPPLWLMQRLGCPESFTPPEHVRDVAMQRGMDFVTITDHNTLEGVKDIQHYDNVIVGNEATTYFPDGTKVHVLTLGIDENQFEGIQKKRHNIFDFVKYLNDNGILHVCAHPLHKVNGRLTWDHFEQLMLLFKRFEALNGTRLLRLNQAAENVLCSLTPDAIEMLSRKHNMQPVGREPWKKTFTAGTDDHSGLFIGTCYTELEVLEYSKQGVLDAIRQGRSTPVGTNDGCLTLAHQINSIAYQYYTSKIGSESQEMLMVLGRIFERKPTINGNEIKRSGFRKNIKKIFHYFRKPKGSGLDLYDEIKMVLRNNKALKNLFQEGIMNQKEFNENVFNLTSDVLDEVILQVLRKPKLLPYFVLFMPGLLASYIMTTKNLHDEKDLIDKSDEWLGIKREPKVAWFTDSFVNMDGVSKTCKVFLEAARQRGKDLVMVTSNPEPLKGFDTLINLKPIRTFPLPGYDKVQLHLPSFLKVLKMVEDNAFDSIVVSTPGPVGLFGMILGKLMKIPVHGIYHTDLPRIALKVSGDPMFGELALGMTRMFYSQVDHVFAPSRWYVEDIANMGISEDGISVLERWVDPDQFSPKYRDPSYWDAEQPVKLLYVGRLSKDKNIDLLVKMYEDLAERHNHFVLHVVGDGPYFEDVAVKTKNWPRFIMTGAKYGEDLVQAYASSDLFVYPGLLDTFGNVVVEAQASGLPCVVMDEGGPPELIHHGETGYIAHTDEEFIQHIDRLIGDRNLCRRMGERASDYACKRFSEERVFTGFWNDITNHKAANGNKQKFSFEVQRNIPNVVSLSA